VLGKKFESEPRYLIERSRLLEEMRGPRHDLEAHVAGHLPLRLLV
jgi:hypothetical protein